MGMFNQDIRKKLSESFSIMQEKVELIYFTQEFECMFCKETRTFLEEIAALNSKITLKIYDFAKDRIIAERYGVDKIPAIVVADKTGEDVGIKFYGIPAGYEINSFIASILEVSGMKLHFTQKQEERIAAITKQIHIEVFVSVGCPYCPESVIAAHRVAMKNRNVKADMVESTIFSYLANKNNVTGVPKTVINGKYEISGAHSVDKLLDIIEKI